MGISRLIRKALIDEKMTQGELASLLGRDYQQVRNALCRDTFTYNIAEEWVNALGYEIVIRNKTTGKVID